MTQPKQIYRGNQARNLLPAVTATLDSSGKRVFTKQELVRLVRTHREQWHIIDSASSNDAIEDFLTALPIRKFVLECFGSAKFTQRSLSELKPKILESLNA